MTLNIYATDFEGLVGQALAIRVDIATLQAPPGTLGDDDNDENDVLSVADMQHLITSIKAKLDSLLNRIKEIKIKTEEDDNDKRAARVLDRLKGHQKEHENLKAALRTATFKMKSNLDKRYERDRALLLEGNTEVRNRIMAQTKLDAIKQSSMLTEDLRRSRAVLTGQVERSLAALQEIDETNKVIDQTIQKHHKYDAVVRTGEGYLTKLKRREFTDRILILFSLVVFLLVVLCIHSPRFFFFVFVP